MLSLTDFCPRRFFYLCEKDHPENNFLAQDDINHSVFEVISSRDRRMIRSLRLASATQCV